MMSRRSLVSGLALAGVMQRRAAANIILRGGASAGPPPGLSPDGSFIFGLPAGGGSGTLTTAYGTVTYGAFLAPHDGTNAGSFNLPMLNGLAMQPGGPNIGAFGYPAMMQLQIHNGGNLYGVGNDQLWSQWDGYSWIGNGGADFAGGPSPTAPVPGPLPTYSPPYTPSSDGASISGGSGSLTTIDGTWGFGTAGSGGWRATLNGIEIKDWGGTFPHFDQMTIQSHGRMFLHRSDGPGWEHWALYQRNLSTGPTTTPVPINLEITPSRPAIPHGSPVGTFVSDVAVTTSDGSPFSGTYLIRDTDGNPTDYSMSGTTIVVSTPPSFGPLVNFKVSQNGSELNMIFVIGVT
jgi:hypothetical protein